MTDETRFRTIAPIYMRLMMADFPIGLDDAAAAFGNFGHESAGFTELQEKGQKAGRGGYGWPQWTASRRELYEAYCKRNSYDPAADLTNYKFILVELRGTHKRAIDALLDADGLDEKVVAFELAYEVAGVKHYDSRKRWARVAREAYVAEFGVNAPPPPPTPPETPPAPPAPAPAYPDPVTEPWAAVTFAIGIILQALPYLRK